MDDPLFKKILLEKDNKKWVKIQPKCTTSKGVNPKELKRLVQSQPKFEESLKNLFIFQKNHSVNEKIFDKNNFLSPRFTFSSCPNTIDSPSDSPLLFTSSGISNRDITDPRFLSVNKGDGIEVLTESDNTYFARNVKTKELGYIPKDCLEKK